MNESIMIARKINARYGLENLNTIQAVCLVGLTRSHTFKANMNTPRTTADAK